MSNTDIAKSAEEKLKYYASKLYILKQQQELHFSKTQEKHFLAIRTINPGAFKTYLKEKSKLGKEIEETNNAYCDLFYKTYKKASIEAKYSYEIAEKEAQGKPEVFAKLYKVELDKVNFNHYLSQLYFEAEKDRSSTAWSLHEELNKERESYLKNPTAKTLKNFQTNCKMALEKARKPMEELGLKDILNNLLKAIASFGTLLIYNKHTYDKFFVSDNFKHFTRLEKSVRAMDPEFSEENEENNNVKKPNA